MRAYKFTFKCPEISPRCGVSWAVALADKATFFCSWHSLRGSKFVLMMLIRSPLMD